jgi:hypothetical protein
MPKFPGLSGAEIILALEKLGFVVARQSGSHIARLQQLMLMNFLLTIINLTDPKFKKIMAYR